MQALCSLTIFLYFYSHLSFPVFQQPEAILELFDAKGLFFLL